MRTKIYIYLFIPLLLIVGLFSLSNYMFLYPSVKEYIMVEKKTMIKELTNIAISIIDNVDNKHNDSLSDEDLKLMAIEELRTINYGHENKSYFWITDLQPKMLMHPYKQDLEGTLVDEFMDITGKKFFIDAVKTVKANGEGYINYHWQWQNDSTLILPKLSYIKLYKNWNWIVGTGIYMNDLESELDELRKDDLINLLLIAAFIVLLVVIIARYTLKSEKARMQALSQLQSSNEKFQNLFQLSNDIVIVSDFTGKIIDINDKALNTYGLKHSEVVGKTTFEMMPEKYHAPVKERIQSIFTKELEPIEIELTPKKGVVITVESKTSLFYHNNETVLLSTMRDITDRKIQEKQLLNAVIIGEEKERTRIAKELHDGLGPYLSTMKFYFQWLSESDDSDKKAVIIEKGNKSIQEAITILREISNNLNPHILTNYGLMDAITAFIDKFEENNKLKIIYTPTSDIKLSHNIEVALYRIVIEFINNTMKHANADRIYITFKKINNNGIKLIYADNGKGFILNKIMNKAPGLGLLNIKNRISTLDGEFEIKTRPNKGFIATIVINQ